MLQKIWRWLKNLIQRLLSPTPPPPPTPPPQPPRKTDTEYENILMELLDGVDAGWSRGKIKGFLIGKNTTDKKLAAWLRDFGQRWESTEQHRELGRRLRKLGREIEGELGQVATAIATRLQPVSPPPDVTFSEATDANLPPVSRSPEAAALYNRGGEKYYAGDLLGAIADFTQAITLNPNDYQAYTNRGSVYAELGRYTEAIDDYTQAITLNPNYYQAYYNRGFVYNALGRYEEAIVDYTQAITLNPNFYDAYTNRGFVYHELGRNEEAIADFTQALTLNPHHYQAYTNRGAVYDELGRNEEAIADYTQVITLNPNFYDAYTNRGIVYNALGRNEKAIADYDQALSIKPDSWQAWKNRGWAIFNSRGYQAAIENWDEGLTKLNPDNPEYQLGCGTLHYDKGKAYFYQAKREEHQWRIFCREAIKSYREALAILEDNPKLRETYLEVSQKLVIAYRSVGDEEKAKQTWDTAIVILEKWLLEIPDRLNKDRLTRKFDRLYQLEVDRLAQSTNPTEKIQALVLAEARKNLCLTWMQPTPESPHYQEILPLLTNRSDSGNQNRAIIYWHLSPVTITTFILKPNAELKTFSTPTTIFGDSPDFETWMKDWKQDYENSRKKTATTDTWKNDIDSRLNQLASILNLAAIQAEITHSRELILIPHRDLHLLPLHYFFQDTHNTITYLPSAKIGLSLATKPATPLTPNAKLLNIEPETNAGLLFAELEAAVITHFYQKNTHLYANADANNVIAAMQQSAAIFHFTGHAEHNLQAANYSALALANQTQLTQKQIFELELPAYELVCLSACETGLTGKSELISEFVGLASTFLAKQTSFVLSTLWTVNEISTALIIIEFYRQLRTGKTPPVALKQAQNWLRSVTYRDLAKWYRELAADVAATNEDCQEDLEADAAIIEQDSAKMEANLPPYRSAYFWAGFVLTGKVL
ncbi:CHAT domain-containing protein [Oscillatoria salina]|uniref:CHAT domain-containing protein n=1 Tax=Oscillatoria salina TaxID=331517 RepID=UPI001CCFE87B|nr:CHAT domain-containing tetratricopeptide repeat protein [Oscillatoria salina]MBZ8182103.1 tetratricopeptide repeat protein [Oscillatoria salina IIICB1]